MATEQPANVTTMLDGLHHFAKHVPNKAVFTFLASDQSTASLTFAQLDQESDQIRQALSPFGQDNGRILLLLPPGLAYISMFMGILKAKLTAVTAYPPDSPKKLPRLQYILQDAKPELIITLSQFIETVQGFAAGCGVNAAVASIDTLLEDWSGEKRPLPKPTPDQLAFIQYSSGSTSEPKGVLISHRNILANLKAIQSRASLTPNAASVLWLPPYHDMGLVFGIFLPLITGHHSVLMSPIDFIKRPFLWLKALMDYEAEISGIPNFALNHCAKRVTAEQKAQLDLSKLDVLFCGSEPVRLSDINHFMHEFKASRISQNVIQPVYGLAEATLFVTSGLQKRSPFHINEIDTFHFSQGKVKTAANKDRLKISISCGQVVDHHSLKIIDPETFAELPEDHIGEVWLQGDSIALGYLNQPQKTARTFAVKLPNHDGAFLRTGDLGYLHQGELYVTGRLKELMIVRGRNIYPQDVEQLIESSDDDLSRSSGVVFTKEQDGHEKLVAVYGLKRFKGDYSKKVAHIRKTLAEELLLQPDNIVFIKGATPRTTSGKRQRLLTKQMLEHGEFPVLFEWNRATQDGKRPSLHNTPYQPPTTQLEAKLVAIWEDVLEITPIGILDNFLELGGDSLKAVEINGRIEQQLQISLPMTELITTPTVQAIAEAIEKYQAQQSNGQRIQINL
ncbi:MAG: AMP-binding protein [Chloroflexota bacterium]